MPFIFIIFFALFAFIAVVALLNAEKRRKKECEHREAKRREMEVVNAEELTYNPFACLVGGA